MMCILSIRANIYSHVENRFIFIQAWTDEIKHCYKTKKNTSLDSSAKLLWLQCALVGKKVHLLKCPYDQIIDIHFFTFSCTIWFSYISCVISIHYEHKKSHYLDFYFREFTVAITWPCSKAWFWITENDIICAKIAHGFNNKYRKLHEEHVQSFCCSSCDFLYLLLL